MRSSRSARAVLAAHNRGYRVTSTGKVTGLRVDLMQTNTCSSGYERFSIHFQGSVVPVWVHQLAAYQKYGEAALAKGIQVRHLNGNCKDNRLDNISIGNASANQMDKSPEDRARLAKLAGRARSHLTKSKVKEMRAGFRAGKPLSWAMSKFGIAKSTASYIKNRITWKDV